MRNSVEYVDENYRLNQIFSFLVIYYWSMVYIKHATYIMWTLPITFFIGYSILIYIKNFSSTNKVSFILGFVAISGYLSFIRFDYTSLIAVTLLGLTIFFIEHFKLRVKLSLINTLFFISVILSIPLYYSGYSSYGFLPGQGGFSYDLFLSGRISMFPNVTVSLYFSFIIFFINYFFNKNFIQKLIVSLLALYFIYFGISRTLMIGLLFILFFTFLFKIYPLKKNLFYQIVLPFILIFLPIIVVSFINEIISFLINLHSDFISEYFLRGYNSVDKVLDDIARTRIWSEHIRLFKEFPWGLSIEQIELFSDKSLHLSDGGGSESFLTRILVRFGFGAIFFYLYIFSLLKKALDTRNEYIYIFVYIFIFIGINYGSFFAAYNMLFLIFISSINNPYLKEKEDL